MNRRETKLLVESWRRLLSEVGKIPPEYIEEM